MSNDNDFEDVPLTAEELALARRWATSQIGRPSTRTDTRPLSQRKATVLIYRLLATIDRLESTPDPRRHFPWLAKTGALFCDCGWNDRYGETTADQWWDHVLQAVPSSEKVVSPPTPPQVPPLTRRGSMKFWTSGLVSKWGFSDGDQLSDWCYDFEEETGAKVDDHALLIEVIRGHVLPFLDQTVTTEIISTIHNPVRATEVDAVDVRGLHYEPMAESPITPEVIEVDDATIRSIAARLAPPSENGGAQVPPKVGP